MLFRSLEKGVTPILLSTNAVFDCREPLMTADRMKSPTSLYGQLKSEAEDAILELSPKSIVVRLTKVLTADAELFSIWWRRLNDGQKIHAALDHRLAPVSGSHAVESLIRIAALGSGGIHQVSASSDLSYVDVAHRMADKADKSRSLVEARSATELGIPANEVMHYTSLNTRQTSALTGIKSPDPYAAVEEMIDLLSARSRS